MFIDSVSRAILDLADEHTSRNELVEVCRNAVDEAAQRDLNLDFSRRIDELVRFGALRMTRQEAAPDHQVLLIDPPFYPASDSSSSDGPGKGICYLSHALKKEGIADASTLDLRSVSGRFGEGYPELADYLARYLGDVSPRIIGITAASATISTALSVGRLVRMLVPEAFIVLGGPHASFEWSSLLSSYPFIDAVVRGEGEQPFSRLVAELLEHPHSRDFTSIEGLAWRTADGTLADTGWSPGVEDLDSLGFPDVHAGILNAKDFTIESPRIISSRGCPFSCSFCSTATFFGRRTRYRGSQSVLDEITYYNQTYGFDNFAFDDDIFTHNRKRTLKLCQSIEESYGDRLRWGCSTRIDCIDQEILGALRRAGCRIIFFGIESADLEVRKRINKGARSLDQFQEKISFMLDLGMAPKFNFILGLPGESLDTIDSIKKMMHMFPSAEWGFSFLTVFPGTPLQEQTEELGILCQEQDERARYSLIAPSVSTPTMSREDQMSAYLKLQWESFRTSRMSNDSNQVAG
jgi:radical SAM superfamily enzyme YgiQ (UPF0313 family)